MNTRRAFLSALLAVPAAAIAALKGKPKYTGMSTTGYPVTCGVAPMSFDAAAHD